MNICAFVSRTIYCIQCTSIFIRKIVQKGTLYSLTWLPYVQKALCSESPIFRRSYVQKVLCSENICSESPLFRWSHIQKILYSEGPMFRRSYVQKIFVQKVLCSDGPILRRSYMFRRSYIQKYLFGRLYIQKVLCWEDPIFRRSFVQKVLCWNTFPSFGFRYKNISRFFFISFITLLFTSSRDTREWVSKLRRSRNFKFRKTGAWKPRTHVSKFCRHAWRFALCLFCNWLIYILVFLQWYLITLLQFILLRLALQIALRRILCRLFLYTS